MVTTSNVSYNFQKNPNLNTTFKAQSEAGLIISLRDKVNDNRNVNSIFPVNLSTPNSGAGSPTLLAVQNPAQASLYPYVGRQISSLGEIA